MTTIQELRFQVDEKAHKILVLNHLIDHLNATFRLDGPKKLKLLDDNKVPVSDHVFEAITDQLAATMRQLAEELREINESEIVLRPRSRTPPDPESPSAQPDADIQQEQPPPKPQTRTRRRAAN